VTLDCPRCPSAQLTERSVVPAGGGASANIHHCADCKGIWLDGTVLVAICPTVAHLPDHRDEVALSGQRGAGIAICPRCKEIPYQLDVLGVPIDFCLRCHGVWLDGDEYEESLLDGAEARPAPRGGAYRKAGNRVARGDVKCASCGTEVPMRRSFMREKGHTCANCNSTYEIAESKHRVAASNNSMWMAGNALNEEPPPEPLGPIVEAVYDLFGWNKTFR
jgi:Zn-finger nucleic acid-binding protein